MGKKIWGQRTEKRNKEILQGCILLSRFWFFPPAFDFRPRHASRRVCISMIFFPIFAIYNNVVMVWIVLNCVLLIVFYDLVLSKVIFSPNFLFFPLWFPSPSPDPLIFSPHKGRELNYIQACVFLSFWSNGYLTVMTQLLNVSQPFNLAELGVTLLACSRVSVHPTPLFSIF